MLYVLKKEQIEHVRLRALAQAIVDKDQGKEVFEEYMQVAFPWLKTQKKRDVDEHMRLLNEEVKRGGLEVIQPLWMKDKVRSRMKTRVVEREAATPADQTRMNRVYDKLGRIIPT